MSSLAAVALVAFGPADGSMPCRLMGGEGWISGIGAPT